MTWNHRVVKFDNGYYGICEVYYNEDGKPYLHTEDAVGIVWGEGENEDPRQTLKRMKDCLDKPILTEDDFGGSECD